METLIKDCPICESTDTRKDYDHPETMRACDKCGAEWIAEDGEVTLDPRKVP